MTGGQWRGVPGGVDVHARGQVFSATADHSLGDPWTPSTHFSDAQLIAKFNVMVGLDANGLGSVALQRAATQVIDAVMTLDASPVEQLAGSLAALARSMGEAAR
jgi:hypothetical protein